MKQMKFSVLAKTIAALSLLGCASTTMADQATVDTMSKQLQLNYAIIDNHAGENGIDCSALGADWAACTKVTITLKNDGDAITSKDWSIYFHSIRMVLEVGNDQFKVTHITGDLHKLEPTEKFTGFAANQAVEIPIIAEYWQIFSTDAIPRWYVVSGDAKPKTIANTDTEDLSQFSAPITGDQWKRNKADNNILMTTSNRFEKNQDVSLLNPEELRGQIVPTPMTVTLHDKNVNLSEGVALSFTGVDEDATNVLADHFKRLDVKTSQSGYPVKISINPAEFKDQMAVSGAYKLVVGEKEATIVGYDQAGAFYGVQSILSMVPVQGDKMIPEMEVTDAPRFEYRALFLDVGRNFHTKEAVLRLIDQMSAYKFNKFHFHLSDDEGWRIEIPGLPELTDIGGKRCHDLTEKTCLLPQLGSGPNSDNMGSGHFTRDDYIEILKYAKARQIDVIPEIDMPAHTRAAIVSMEARYDRLMKEGKEAEANEYRLMDPTDTSNTTSVQFYDRRSYLNPCLDSSKRFVDKVIGEIAAMHKEAGLPIQTWHFGGDEAKNIRLGAGYQDINAEKKETWKGTIDQSIEDKPWAKSQACQTMIKDGKVEDYEHLPSHFAIEVSQIVKKHGIDRMQAWQDGVKDVESTKDFATSRVGVNFWDTLYWGGFDSANDWANKGYEVVISNPDYVYLDFPYEVNPSESGYYWGTRFSDERKIFSFAPNNLPQNAETSVDRDGNAFTAKSDKEWPGSFGVSGQLWSEVVRTDTQMEYMIYPRMIPLAERAWHRASWELDYKKGVEFKGGETNHVDKKSLHDQWQVFANLMGQRELAKLDKAGVSYRLPVPGAKIVDGNLEANIALPGLAIEFSTDSGTNWQRYDDANKPKVSGEVMVRTVSPDGKRTSRAEKIS